MTPVVNAIIATAMNAAIRRAPRGDVANGLIAGLRHLRHVADEEAGYTMATAIDGAIHACVLADAMTVMRRTGHEPRQIHLPPPGPASSVAAAIFESAADSCLAVNAHAPDNEPLEHAVVVMASELLRQLDGPPEWGELQAALHRPHGRHGPGPASILPDEGSSLH